MKQYHAIYVRNENTGRFVHHEVFECTGIPPEVLAKRIVARENEPFEQFGIQAHDVFTEGYYSEEMRCCPPEFGENSFRDMDC